MSEATVDLKTKSVLVIDLGLFPYLAETLARSFGKTYYYSNWLSAFPDDKSMQVGVGLPGVTRTDYWEPLISDVDLICFPDTYMGPMQVFLEKECGKRVWGARMAEEMELLREEAKMELHRLGVPIGKFAICEGMDELRDYLKDRENVVVKLSFTRGDKETFRVENYQLAEPELDDLEHRLGPRKNKRKFIVEDAIEPACEIAYDGYTVDGQWPGKTIWGIESKGKAYAGLISDYANLPEQITRNNAKVSGILKEWRARTWFGMETRVSKKDGVPWVIDPLARFGNPAGALCCLMYKNMAEIMWHGAQGRMVQPEFEDKWGVQIQIYSEWSEDHWQPVYYPPSVAPYVKLQYHTRIDGIEYVVPTADKNPAIGSVVATGGTLEEAVDKVSAYADEIKGPGIKIDTKVMDSLKEEFGCLKEYGILL